MRLWRNIALLFSCASALTPLVALTACSSAALSGHSASVTGDGRKERAADQADAPGAPGEGGQPARPAASEPASKDGADAGSEVGNVDPPVHVNGPSDAAGWHGFRCAYQP
jgi:hypothetical protein